MRKGWSYYVPPSFFDQIWEVCIISLKSSWRSPHKGGLMPWRNPSTLGWSPRQMPLVKTSWRTCMKEVVWFYSIAFLIKFGMTPHLVASHFYRWHHGEWEALFGCEVLSEGVFWMMHFLGDYFWMVWWKRLSLKYLIRLVHCCQTKLTISSCFPFLSMAARGMGGAIWVWVLRAVREPCCDWAHVRINIHMLPHVIRQ